MELGTTAHADGSSTTGPVHVGRPELDETHHLPVPGVVEPFVSKDVDALQEELTKLARQNQLLKEELGRRIQLSQVSFPAQHPSVNTSFADSAMAMSTIEPVKSKKRKKKKKSRPPDVLGLLFIRYDVGCTGRLRRDALKACAQEVIGDTATADILEPVLRKFDDCVARDDIYGFFDEVFQQLESQRR